VLVGREEGVRPVKSVATTIPKSFFLGTSLTWSKVVYLVYLFTTRVENLKHKHACIRTGQLNKKRVFIDIAFVDMI